MRFTIKDEKAANDTVITAENAADALEAYVRNECHDVDDGDEVNVTIVDELGAQYEGTAEIEVVRNIDVFVSKKHPPRARKAVAAPKETP